MEFSRCARAGARPPEPPLFGRADDGNVRDSMVSQNSTACAISDKSPTADVRMMSRSTFFQASSLPGRFENHRRTSACRSNCSGIPRKEVIQPQLPLRLPCYDFTPIVDPTFDGCLLREVSPPASGIADFRGVTGGVYKARERIHRGVADPRLLATPPSWRRVSASNPNRDRLFGIRSHSRVCSPLYRPM
jgi:hypothetical protein